MGVPGLIYDAYALAEMLTSDGHVLVPGGAHVVFHVSYNDMAVGLERDDMQNVIISLMNTATSPTMQKLLDERNEPLEILNVNISRAVPSGFNPIGIVRINPGDIDFKYRTMASEGRRPEYVNFNLQHIVNHELMHWITGRDDGDLVLNSQINKVNGELWGGPARSDDYFDTIPHGISGGGNRLAGGPDSNRASDGHIEVIMADGSVMYLDVSKNGSAGPFAHTKFASADAAHNIIGSISPSQQYDLANKGAFAHWQVTGSGPEVKLASGSSANVGTVFAPGNGEKYVVLPNGAIANAQTGQITAPPPSASSGGKPSQPTATTPALQPHTQVTGSGPSVTTSSGSSTNSGTTFNPGNGYTYVVNKDGTTTNVQTGHTYGGGGKKKPVVLDLDGDGVEITDLSSSNVFFDTVGGGKQHRTAWAGAGDGILVRDAGNDGVINQQNEIDFTSWAPSAKSDMQALLAVFDTNHDGKLSALDAEWSLFKVLVTNANGTQTLRTMGELGITAINLISNNQEVTLPDGSKIVGTTTFTKSDGSTGTVADAVLAYEAAGYVVTKTTTTNGDGSTTIENRATNADGSLANKTVLTTSADGNTRTTSFDNNGDGVNDRVQTLVRVVNGDGSVTETMQEKDGGGTILLRKEVTVTSADKKTVTVSRDVDGSGVNDQIDSRVTAVDGSQTVTVTNLNANGSTHDRKATTTSADGLTKTIQVELTGSGVVNATRTAATSVAGDGTRTETATDYAGNGVTTAHRIGKTVTTTSVDGANKVVAADLDGNATTDVTTTSVIVHNGDGSDTTTQTTTNGDASLRNRTITVLSADGNTKAVQVDLDGNGTYDLTTHTVTTFSGGSTTKTVTDTYANAATARQTSETWSADGKTRSVSVDSDGDGVADRTQTVAVVGSNSVDTGSIYSANGSALLSRSVTTTSSTGLSRTVQSDVNGDGTYDATATETKVINGDGSSTVTRTTTNGAGTVQIAKTVTTTSANGLSTTVQSYLNGGASPYKTVTDVKVLNGDNSITRTVTDLEGTSQVQAGKLITILSADRLTETVQSFVGTNSLPESVVVTVTSSDGSKTQTASSYSPNGATLLGKTTTTVSSDGLTRTVVQDADGNTVTDGTTVSAKTLNTDGTTTVTDTAYQGSGTAGANKVAQSTTTTSGNGLTVNVQTDANGDGTLDSRTTSVTTVNADGSKTTIVTSFNGAGTVQTGKTVTTVSDDGLTKSVSTFLGNHTTADGSVTEVTALNSDGSSTQTTSVFSGSGALTARTVTTKSGNGLSATVSTDLDGNGTNDVVSVISTAANGSVNTVTSTYGAGGVLTARSTKTVSGDGLSTTIATDLDGNGTTDRTQTDVVVLNADGSKTQTRSIFDGTSTLKGKTITTVSADGLSKTTTWDGTGAGSTTRSQTDVQTINADGSTTRTLSNMNANGSLHDKTITTTSVDGLISTTTEDVDGNAVVDHTFKTVQALDGSVTTSRMDGSVLSASGRAYGSAKGTYETVNATGLSKTIRYDASGDGLAESQTTEVVVLNTDGSRVRTITHSTLTGGVASAADPVYTVTNKEKAVVTTTANGLSKTTQWDLTGSGTLTDSQTDIVTLNADGSSTQTVSTLTGATLKSRYTSTTSADGLVKTTQWDSSGTGTYAETSTATTVRNADGSTTQTTANTNASSALISKFVTTTSADGRTTTTQKDFSGAGTYSETETVVRVSGADGSSTQTRSIVLAGGALKERSVTTISSDGVTISTSRDANGDGIVDQTEVITNAVDGSTTTVTTDWSVAGAKIGQLTSIRSADGRMLTSLRDLDGDGMNDRSTTRTMVYNADGSSTETLQIYKISDKVGGVPTVISPVLMQTVTTAVSADGRTKTSTVDVDGNGTVDETSVLSLKINGSSVTNVTDNAAARGLAPSAGDVVWTSTIATTNKTVPAATITTVSSDGNSRTVQADYDGNGTYEHVQTWKTKIDGSQTATLTEVNASSVIVARGTQTISADGKTTSLTVDANNDGFSEHIESSVVRVDGSKVKTSTDYNVGGSLKSSIVSTVSSNGNSIAYAFTGGAANDGFTGGDGDDTLDGGAGNDTLVGGKGNDTYVIDSASDVITELAGEGVDTVKANYTYTLGATLENLTLLGSSAINGTGNASDNILIGNSAANTLTGGDGNDTLDGGAGNDTLVGGNGNDIYVVDSLSDVVTESGTGTDTVRASITYSIAALGTIENLTLIGAASINATGNALANSITGNSGANTLDGGAGNDVLLGGDGDDLLLGGLGADQLVGGAGTDTASYQNATAGVVVHTGNPAVNTGEALGDTYSSIEIVRGSAFADEIIVVQDQVKVYGGTGNDTLTTAGTNGSLYGEDGDDTLYGSDNVDHLDGGAGNDLVHGHAGADTLILGAGIDYGYGGDGNDVIDGGAAGDSIFGEAGDDVLIGGAGDDHLDGGDGIDTVSYETATAGVNIDTRNLAASTGDAAGDWFVSIEAFKGSAYADTIYVGMNGFVLRGGGGNDSLTAVGANVSIYGDAGNDTLVGGGSADVLDGGVGADTMFGGAGNDLYIVDDVGDWVEEAAGNGNDTVQSSVDFTLTATVENLTLTGSAAVSGTGNGLNNVLIGNSAANYLEGGGGNDTIDGGAGADVLAGGIGNDTYTVDDQGDWVEEAAGAGTDTVFASVHYTLSDNVENLTLTGSSNISATGNGLANNLVGNNGSNYLDGGAGNDTLDGGAGADVMAGGIGNDTYYVDHSGDWVEEATGQGNDTVISTVSLTLFDNADSLVLIGSSAINATGNGLDNYIEGNSAANVITGGGGNDYLVGGAGNDTFVFSGVSGDDYVDDFQAHGGTANGDIIELHGESTSTFAALLASMTEAGGSTFVNLDGGDSIELHGITKSQLTANDFRFV